MDQERLRQQIEACRAGDEPVEQGFAELAHTLTNDPHARETLSRLQRLDRRIAEAIGDVPVPAGLSDRILARLRESQGPAEAAVEPRSAIVPVKVPDGTRRQTWSRRKFTTTLAMAAGLVGVSLLGGWLVFGDRRVMNAETIADEARTLSAGYATNSDAAWVATDPSRSFPLSAAVTSGRNPRWRTANGFLGTNQAIAYDLGSAGGARGILFVARRKAAALPGAPPSLPQSTTGGACVGTWQEGNLLYVLVVHGDVRDYQRFVAPTGELT